MSSWTMHYSTRELVKLTYIASLTALAIVLRFFEIPYPPAPFLKYDVSGIPLAIIGFMSLRYLPISLPIYYLIPVLTGSDVIGMAMKILAETSTLLPLVIIYKKLYPRKITYPISIVLAIVSRVVVMSITNIIITPYWLILAGWVKDFETAYKITLGYIPHIAIFNATLALVVSTLSISLHGILRKTGIISGQ